MSNKTAEQLESEAKNLFQQSADSFDRCDTDGCVTQWCADWSGREKMAQAEIVRNGGKAWFYGLYDEQGNRIPANKIETQYGTCWILREDAASKYGRKFIPAGLNSKVQKKLGVKQWPEMANAWAKLSGSGYGLSGLSSLFVATFRTDKDDWGMNAEPIYCVPNTAKNIVFDF